MKLLIFIGIPVQDLRFDFQVQDFGNFELSPMLLSETYMFV